MIEIEHIRECPSKLEWKVVKKRHTRQPVECSVLIWKKRDAFYLLMMGIESFGENQFFYTDFNRYLRIGDYTYWVSKKNNHVICRRKNDDYDIDEVSKEVRTKRTKKAFN